MAERQNGKPKEKPETQNHGDAIWFEVGAAIPID
jgi:hypothetical protein